MYFNGHRLDKVDVPRFEMYLIEMIIKGEARGKRVYVDKNGNLEDVKEARGVLVREVEDFDTNLAKYLTDRTIRLKANPPALLEPTDVVENDTDAV